MTQSRMNGNLGYTNPGSSPGYMQNNMNPWLAGALGGAGVGMMSGMFDQNNPADAAMPYLNQIPGMMKDQYQPYINAGQQALPQLQGQYSDLMSNPGGKLNSIGANYKQSPGFNLALKQALQSTNHGAAAGGMYGSPQNDYQNMDVASGLASRDYDTWLQHALGMYGMGMQGEQGMYNTGYSASNNLANGLGQNLMNQGQLAYEGQAGQNQAQGNMFGQIGQIGSMLAAFL